MSDDNNQNNFYAALAQSGARLMAPKAEPPSRTDQNWIETFSGRKFWPLNPDPEDVDIFDIAHALSMCCRYAGHVKYFYSVAQHSVLVSYAVPPKDALWALLHDAPEAYLADVSRPVKPYLTGFQEIEDRIMAVVANRFGLAGEMPESVKRADLEALATERRDLMPNGFHRWGTIEGVTPWPEQIFAYHPKKARDLFLGRFYELRDAA